MKIAVKYSGLRIDADGTVGAHDAGTVLVRRMLRLFHGAELIGPASHRYEGFDLLPLEFVDADNTLVINMDVIDSGAVYRELEQHTKNPKIMNFVWWNTTSITSDVDQAFLALSFALFPTFANSERTANEIQAYVKRLTPQHLAERAKLAWVNLGIRLEYVQPREEPSTPVVLYPAIYLSERKHPEVFVDVVSRVAKTTPIRVEMRLAEKDLVSPQAMALARQRWAWVGPMTPTRSEYWKQLAHTTAFLATSEQESYGLEYVEAMISGAIGILPNHGWARALVPPDYPFLYDTPAEAEQLLVHAVTETEACRAELDKVAGGSFLQWMEDRHSDDAFDKAIVQQVRKWFGSAN
ncbi:MAG: hypothetical protein LBM66_07390 [Bifidobacteriaceae bacterium]|jgi:hypothetical protein|nr:hypothetical protein [Bifidobacteriaceae bacterium]